MNDDISGYSDRDLLVSLHTKVGLITTSLADHEIRIRKNEHNMWLMRGAISIVVFVSTLLEPFLTWKAHK